MTKEFKSMNELTEYLENLEKRVVELEQENYQLQNRIGTKNKLPKTDLLHPNFLKRAFAIWGHFFTAHLIISLVFGSIYFCFVVVLLNQVLGSVIQVPEITATPAYIIPPP